MKKKPTFALVGLILGMFAIGSVGLVASAAADESEGGGPGSGKGQQGSAGGGKGQGGSTHVPSGSGPSDDSDAKGPQFKGGGDHGNADAGSRPPWAQEGIPEVELGRLSVARSPDHVLERALTEAYTTNLDKDSDGVLDGDADVTIIDSPLANLTLYKEALAGERLVDGTWTLDEAASFLGRASDKNLVVSTDTVIALNTIFGYPEFDYSAYSYDRSATYPGEMTTVFADAAYTGTGLDAFAQAADDARAVILYYHDL